MNIWALEETYLCICICISDRCLCAISMKASRARRCLVRNELTTVIAGAGRQCYFHMPLTGIFKREAKSFEQFLILAPSYNCTFSCMCNRKYLNGFIWPSMLLSYATDRPFQERGKELLSAICKNVHSWASTYIVHSNCYFQAPLNGTFICY